MFISLERSSTVGFRKWSTSQTPDCNDNDDPDRGNRAVMTALVRLGPMLNGLVSGHPVTSGTEDEHRPWLVPGVGTSFRREFSFSTMPQIELSERRTSR